MASGGVPRQGVPHREWIPDSACSSCGQCRKHFGLFRRRHHCRLCGRIFCGDCSKYKAEIIRDTGLTTFARVCFICHGDARHQRPLRACVESEASAATPHLVDGESPLMRNATARPSPTSPHRDAAADEATVVCINTIEPTPPTARIHEPAPVEREGFLTRSRSKSTQSSQRVSPKDGGSEAPPSDPSDPELFVCAIADTSPIPLVSYSSEYIRVPGSKYVDEDGRDLGGQAEVWLCTQRECPDTVREQFVLKLYHRRHSRRMQHAMEREKRLLRHCAYHPNILQLYKVFQEPNMCFSAVYEKMDGDLFHLMVEQEGSGLLRAQAPNVLRQLLRAVAFLHNDGIVHRDVKPDNVLFRWRRGAGAENHPDGPLEIKLADFGFSKPTADPNECAERTPDGKFVGTDRYCDMKTGDAYEATDILKFDVWSVGVVAYFLLNAMPGGYHNPPSKAEIQQYLAGHRGLPLVDAGGLTAVESAFLQSLMKVRRADRPTAAAALQHAYLRSTTTMPALSSPVTPPDGSSASASFHRQSAVVAFECAACEDLTPSEAAVGNVELESFRTEADPLCGDMDPSLV